MELMIPLNSQSGKPLYEQIYQYIKSEIQTGGLRAGKKLPSSRELAKSLKVSRSTTQLAYEQLVSEGYLETMPRKGYFVTGFEGILPSAEEKGRVSKAGAGGDAAGEDEGDSAEKKDCASREEGAKQETAKGYTVDFSPRGVDLEHFPFSTWQKISRAVLKEGDRSLLLKGDPKGELSLREAIREYLHGARGVSCQVSQIIVGAGSEYLLMLLSGLLGREAGIAMENPTHRQAGQIFSNLGHRVWPVGMDSSGLCAAELFSLPNEVRAAYVMPSHQFPTGTVMPVKRRQELLSWAEEEGRYLIEDDYDSEFRYKGKPIPALQGLDQKGKVIYMGTFSKAIAPAIRVGYLVLPKELLSRYERQGSVYSSTVSRVDQRILAEFISGGYFERHLNRMREIYKRKHDTLLAELKPLEAEFKIEGENAGLHVLLTHRGNKKEAELMDAAGKAGVKVYGLSGYFIGEKQESKTILLGFARLSEEEIKKGVRLLREIKTLSDN